MTNLIIGPVLKPQVVFMYFTGSCKYSLQQGEGVPISGLKFCDVLILSSVFFSKPLKYVTLGIYKKYNFFDVLLDLLYLKARVVCVHGVVFIKGQM